MSRHCPEAIEFSNAEEIIRTGCGEIEKHGELTMDVGGMGGGNTLAVCALLEWKRKAAGGGCRLQFENIPPRLEKLISVYQLKEVLLDSSGGGSSGGAKSGG